MFSTYGSDDRINDKPLPWLVSHFFDINTGFVFWNWLNVSLAIRIGFPANADYEARVGINPKFSIGYVWRFK
jgi:hypothetical protein